MIIKKCCSPLKPLIDPKSKILTGTRQQKATSGTNAIFGLYSKQVVMFTLSCINIRFKMLKILNKIKNIIPIFLYHKGKGKFVRLPYISFAKSDILRI